MRHATIGVACFGLKTYFGLTGLLNPISLENYHGDLYHNYVGGTPISVGFGLFRWVELVAFLENHFWGGEQ